MKRARYLVTIGVVVMMIGCMKDSIYANSRLSEESILLNQQNKIIEYQLNGFEKLKDINYAQDNNTEYNLKSSNINELEDSESYPIKKGSILVTDDGSLGSLVGHAGIVYSPTKTIESFPDGGVAYYDNDWNTRYKTVYGAEVINISSEESDDAAERAKQYIGKPYNWNFMRPNTVNSFYCSQLVYRAYMDATEININRNGWVVFPIDLIKSKYTTLVYKQN